MRGELCKCKRCVDLLTIVVLLCQQVAQIAEDPHYLFYGARSSKNAERTFATSGGSTAFPVFRVCCKNPWYACLLFYNKRMQITPSPVFFFQAQKWNLWQGRLSRRSRLQQLCRYWLLSYLHEHFVNIKVNILCVQHVCHASTEGGMLVCGYSVVPQICST